MLALSNHRPKFGFTLIELLVVISIIAILVGLSFPVIGGMMDRAKKVQAKNDITQIVTAVSAFYTEYGKYPLPANQSAQSYTYAGNNDQLFNIIRGNEPTQNPRNVVFLNIPAAKDSSNPKGGIGGDFRYYDPWGMPYSIAIDSDYNNKIDNPYKNAGFDPMDAGVIAYSSGKNKVKDADAKVPTFDDVLSWQ